MRIREAQKHMDPTDPDTEHWFLDVRAKFVYAQNLRREKFPVKYALRFSRKGKSSVSDPDSIRPVDPLPDSESGSRRSKMTQRSWKKIQKFHLTCMLSSRAPSPPPTQRFNGFFRCARYANKLQREQFLMKSASIS
jgi:hypothetical protein